MTEALKHFIQNYSEQRDVQKSNYTAVFYTEVDFKKTNDKYLGEDSVKLDQYIYLMKTNGYSYKEISTIVEITRPCVCKRYNKFLNNLKK